MVQPQIVWNPVTGQYQLSEATATPSWQNGQWTGATTQNQPGQNPAAHIDPNVDSTTLSGDQLNAIVGAQSPAGTAGAIPAAPTGQPAPNPAPAPAPVAPAPVVTQQAPPPQAQAPAVVPAPAAAPAPAPAAAPTPQPQDILKEFLESDPDLALNMAWNSLARMGASRTFLQFFRNNFSQYWGRYLGVLAEQANKGELPSLSFIDFVRGLDPNNDFFGQGAPGRGVGGSASRFASFAAQSGGRPV